MSQMTTGQRIAQKRRERNLSQEALGEALGLSRQSISKWESDSSMPEIDKLVSLSRLFGVSVGWLLGVEEQNGERSAVDAGELTAEQLKIVEEIVERYIAAQPRPMSRRRKQVLKGAAIVAACCFALGLFWWSGQMAKLENQYNDLRNSVDWISESVNSQINGIGSRVEEILQAQNDLTADHWAGWVERDIEAGMVTLRAYAVPKTYQEGMTAQFLAECDGQVLAFPAELGEGQTFSATFDCPLVDSIVVSVVFLNGETRETQRIEQISGLYSETVPVVELDDVLSYDDAGLKEGKLNLQEAEIGYRLLTSSGDRSQAAVTAVKVGLFRNRRLVAWGTPVDGEESGRDGRGWQFVRFAPVTIPVEAGDTLCYGLLVTDAYGRTTVRGGSEYMVIPASGGGETAPGGKEVQVEQVTGSIGYGRYDDPADWGLTGD